MESFKWNSFREYLIDRGLIDETIDIIQAAKKEYLKLYLRYYRAKRNKQQVNVLMKSEDVNYLEGKVEEHTMKKLSCYIRHLITQDMERKCTHPNLLIDIEVGILKCIDGLGRIMKARPETRSALIDTCRQLEELIKILTL